MYPSEIVAEVQALLQEQSTSAFATAANIIRFANPEYVKLLTHIGYVSDRYRTSTTFSVTADTAEYDLPDRCMAVRALQNPDDLEYNPLQRWHDGTIYLDYGFTVRARKVVITPTPTTAGTWTIHYDERPPLMTYGTATAGAASTITMASTVTGGWRSRYDDYYNNAEIVISAGTSIGDTRTVSDYVGSTRVVTVSVAFTSTPDTTSVYEIVADLDTDYLSGLAHLTAAHVALIDGQRELAFTLRGEGMEIVLAQLLPLIRTQRRSAPVQLDTFWD